MPLAGKCENPMVTNQHTFFKKLTSSKPFYYGTCKTSMLLHHLGEKKEEENTLNCTTSLKLYCI